MEGYRVSFTFYILLLREEGYIIVTTDLNKAKLEGHVSLSRRIEQKW